MRNEKIAGDECDVIHTTGKIEKITDTRFGVLIFGLGGSGIKLDKTKPIIEDL